jgi:hypothetical protein
LHGYRIGDFGSKVAPPGTKWRLKVGGHGVQGGDAKGWSPGALDVCYTIQND